jgi:heme exporter protein D
MQFDSIQAALEMGGHGPYVWASYIITFFVLTYLFVSPLRRASKTKADIRRVVVRDETLAAQAASRRNP